MVDGVIQERIASQIFVRMENAISVVKGDKSRIAGE